MSQESDYQKELSNCSTMADITGPDGLKQKIIKNAVEQVLGREISAGFSTLHTTRRGYFQESV